MKYSSSATVTFGAGHAMPNEWCGDKPHGHQYRVTATWQNEGFPATDLLLWTVTRQKVLDLALELKNRQLDKMLGPAVPNVYGVASFFMERLSLHAPIIRIEVREDDDPVAIIENDID